MLLCVLIALVVVFISGILLAVSIVLLVLGSSSMEPSQRAVYIQLYTEKVQLWNTLHFQINSNILFETFSKNKTYDLNRISMVDKINDTARPGETFPFYTPIQFQNSAFPFFVNETFNAVDSLAFPLQYYTSNSPHRVSFKDTLKLSKFKTQEVDLNSVNCLFQGGNPASFGKCTFYLKIKSLCAVVNFNNLDTEPCPGEVEFGKYEKFPFKEIAAPQSSISEFFLREVNDPFIFLHQLTKGKLNFGEPKNGIGMYGTGIVLLSTSIISGLSSFGVLFLFGCLILCVLAFCMRRCFRSFLHN
jgi:Fe-S-cluster containining protein